MASWESVFEPRADGAHALIARGDDGRVTVDIGGELSPEELQRVAQHLLLASGVPAGRMAASWPALVRREQSTAQRWPSRIVACPRCMKDRVVYTLDPLPAGWTCGYCGD